MTSRLTNVKKNSVKVNLFNFMFDELKKELISSSCMINSIKLNDFIEKNNSITSKRTNENNQIISSSSESITKFGYSVNRGIGFLNIKSDKIKGKKIHLFSNSSFYKNNFTENEINHFHDYTDESKIKINNDKFNKIEKNLLTLSVKNFDNTKIFGIIRQNLNLNVNKNYLFEGKNNSKNRRNLNNYFNKNEINKKNNLPNTKFNSCQDLFKTSDKFNPVKISDENNKNYLSYSNLSLIETAFSSKKTFSKYKFNNKKFEDNKRNKSAIEGFQYLKNLSDKLKKNKKNINFKKEYIDFLDSLKNIDLNKNDFLEKKQ